MLVPFHESRRGWVGSFSTKNLQKYEVIFNLPGNGRIAAYFCFNAVVARYATVTFHPVIFTQLQGGGFRENANLAIFSMAPNPLLFSIRNCTFNVFLAPFFETYWLQWSQDYDIFVDNVVWETFTHQEQFSHSTTLHPFSQHNLLNDNLWDVNQDDDLDLEEGDDNL